MGVDLRLAGDQVSPLTEHTQGFVLFSSDGQKPELIPHRGELQTRQLDRLDRCDWSLTICPHILHETHGCRVILEVAALTQNH